MHKEHWLVPRYLHWTFRASFYTLVITDFIAFFLICGAWACAIYLGSLVSPRCFVVAGTPLSDMEDWKENFYFMDAFQLSWTTFSTVVSPTNCGISLASCGKKPKFGVERQTIAHLYPRL